jgi:predicted transcriptional regulator
MREDGVLKGEERTGKGGHRWVYSPAMDEQQYKQYLAKTIIESLMRDFPEETRAALKNLEP